MSDETTRDAVHSNRLNDLKICLNDEEFYVDVNQPDEHLWTYLMYAVRFGFNDIVTYLLEVGADIHAVKGDGNNVLHIAAREGLKDTLLILLSHGAVPVTRNKSGVQAFTLARQQGHDDCARLLVEASQKYEQELAKARDLALKAEAEAARVRAEEAAAAAAEAEALAASKAQGKGGKGTARK